MSASVALNTAIIQFHAPRVVFQTGLDARVRDLSKQLYGLRNETPIPRYLNGSHILGYAYRMDDGRPWIIFRHFASRGFSNEDSETIQRHARDLGWPPKADPDS